MYLLLETVIIITLLKKKHVTITSNVRYVKIQHCLIIIYKNYFEIFNNEFKVYKSLLYCIFLFFFISLMSDIII